MRCAQFEAIFSHKAIARDKHNTINHYYTNKTRLSENGMQKHVWMSVAKIISFFLHDACCFNISINVVLVLSCELCLHKLTWLSQVFIIIDVNAKTTSKNIYNALNFHTGFNNSVLCRYVLLIYYLHKKLLHKRPHVGLDLSPLFHS